MNVLLISRNVFSYIKIPNHIEIITRIPNPKSQNYIFLLERKKKNWIYDVHKNNIILVIVIIYFISFRSPFLSFGNCLEAAILKAWTPLSTLP